jgi:hypothetical protein
MESGRRSVRFAFEGEVDCRRTDHVPDLQLHGYVRSSSGLSDADVFFTGTSAVGLPPQLHDVSVVSLAPQRKDIYRIESRQVIVEVQCRSMQSHRAMGAQLFAAVPPRRVPWRTRVGWALLLWALRLPGIAPMVAGSRGER